MSTLVRVSLSGNLVCPHFYSVHDKRQVLTENLDFFILTFCCLMYFTNYLDRSNLANAYVSGMKEDLKFKGNQFNLINTIFTVGYVCFGVKSQQR